MKKKMLLVLSFIVVMMCVLMIAASAEVFKVNYNDGKAYGDTDENGQITLRTDKISSTDSAKTFYGWFSLEGDMYEPGETITITKDTNLYEAYGYPGTMNSLPLGGTGQWDWPFIQLQEDLVLTNAMNPPWGGCATVDLNGHTITTSAKNAVEQTRGGIRFVGEGTIIHTGSGHFFQASTHGYGDGSQYLLIGKDVTVKTGGTLLYYTNNVNSAIPLYVYGDVTCKQVAYISGFNDGKTLNVILNPSNLQITGDAFIKCGTYPADTRITVSIPGGTFELTEAANQASYWTNEKGECYSITVTGGAFTNGAQELLKYATGFETHTVQTNNLTYTVLRPEAVCEHQYEKTTVPADCVNVTTETYVCPNCSDTYVIGYGELSEHIWELTSDTPPTTTQTGLKVYTCPICTMTYEVIYSFDPSDIIINVTVNTEDGEKIVKVAVKDVLDLTAVDNLGSKIYTLVGVKAFDSYAVTDILGIEIPIGISYLNMNANSTLKTITFLDNANIVVQSFKNASAVTKLYIKAAKIEFLNGCCNNVLQGIYSYDEGADVFFNKTSFDNKSSIVDLKLSTNSKYIFGANSFRQTGITEFVVPDYADVTFLNEAAFYKCNSLKYIYLGRGLTVLEGKPFDYCQYVEKVVMMEITSISLEWTFCVQNMAEKPVEYYIHSESISLPNNTFGQSKGIVIYTNAPITNTNAFASCSGKTYDGVDYPAYTIVYGVPHKYTEAYIDSTCTDEGVSGYITDCPCGEQLDGSVVARKYLAAPTSSNNYEDVVYESIVIPAKGHKEGVVIGIEYVNGYNSLGLKTCTCSVCTEEYVELTPSAPALITFLGYSTNEARTELTIGYTVDLETLALYEQLSQSTVEFGVVGAITEDLGGKTPHAAQESGTTIIDAVVTTRCPAFDFIIKGFNEELYDLEMTMSAYVKETKKDGTTAFAYIQSTQTDAPSSYTLGACIAAIESK